MGWDIKATADSLAQALPDVPAISQNVTLPQAANFVMVALAVIGIAGVLTRLVPRVWAHVEDVFFTNWRLGLLGSAALLLSVAGAWTTWDGMRNFTGESVLSAFFTFGIHGVMLIVAWLIGESFATGMNQVSGAGGRKLSPPLVAISVLGGGLLLSGLVFAVVRAGVSEGQFLFGSLAAGLALLLISTFVMFSTSDVVQPYAQGLRIILKNGMLWVMFLACMATSVFFSFDSRFNVIFPKDQRERAAEIRTKNQVAGIVSDIGDTIAARRLEEAQALFESDGWKKYDTQLDALAKASEGAEGLIEAHFTREMEAHRASIAEQQERMATAVSGQAGLQSKKNVLTDELSRLKADRPGLAADLAGKKSELDARAKEVDAKRVEAMAEDKGVEGTLKEGKGPIYRQRLAELGRLKDYYKIGEERVRDAQKRIEAVDSRISQIERELAGVDGSLAQLKGEATTAEQRITAAEATQKGKDGVTIDPARVRGEFERARADFRQAPTVEQLEALHSQCVQLYEAMISADATKDRVRDIDCDPKQATEASAQMFALNAGHKTFVINCAGGDKLPQTGAVDSLLDFGRKCLQDSGLPTKDSNAMAEKISFIDLNRDDKAHNFVVSLNAFHDGNRLAYLALAIAIGIDSLIFMAGLFGANAVRSPLADVPSLKARNSQQLNAMIETALLPDTFRKARLVAQAMHPVENVDGFSNEVRLDELDPETAMQVREVLNAGAIIGAVRAKGKDGRYLVRSEMLEFLNMVIKRELEVNAESAQRELRLVQLEDQLTVALMPKVGVNSEAVLHQLDPIDELNGFTSEVFVDRVMEDVRPPLLNVLNAASTFQLVQRDKDEPDRYYIHKDLYKTLARIRAREAQRGLPSPSSVLRVTKFGGAAKEQQAKLTHGPQPVLASTDHFRALLLDAVGVKPEVLGSLHGPTFGAAQQANEAFQHVRQVSPLLDQELIDREEEAQRAFQIAFDRLYGTANEDQRRGLKEIDEEMGQLWQVLMLTQGGPYEAALRELVEQLEPDNGAGTLPGDQTELLQVGRWLLEVMGSNPRANEADWMQIERIFHQAARNQPQQVGLGDDKRTLN